MLKLNRKLNRIQNSTGSMHIEVLSKTCFSYRTVIGRIVEGIYIVNNHSYSNTTSKHQRALYNYLRNNLATRDMDILSIDMGYASVSESLESCVNMFLDELTLRYQKKPFFNGDKVKANLESDCQDVINLCNKTRGKKKLVKTIEACKKKIIAYCANKRKLYIEGRKKINKLESINI